MYGPSYTICDCCDRRSSQSAVLEQSRDGLWKASTKYASHYDCMVSVQLCVGFSACRASARGAAAGVEIGPLHAHAFGGMGDVLRTAIQGGVRKRRSRSSTICRFRLLKSSQVRGSSAVDIVALGLADFDRQVMQFNPGAAIQDGQTFHDIPQFAHVAGPGIDLHLPHGFRRKPPQLQLHLA